MEILFDKKSQQSGAIKIKIQPSDYQEKVAIKLKDYSKKASIKGFRPGKVPASLIKKMYGKGILVEEINTLLQENLTKYIKENKLPVIGDPLPSEKNSEDINWDSPENFEFNFDLGLIPEFDIPFKKIELSKYVITPEKKYIEESIKDLKNRYGSTIYPDVVAKGDFIYGSIEEVEGEFKAKGLIPVSNINDKEFEKLIGRKKDETVSFNLHDLFNSDWKAISNFTGIESEKAKNLKPIFTIAIENITRTTPAEMNQEFYDKALGINQVNDEEGFIKKLTESVQENYNRETLTYLNRELKDQVVENVKLELPEEFLKRWLKLRNERELTVEQIEKEFAFYAKELKWNIIKNKLSEEHNIKVEQDEVAERARQILTEQFSSYGLFDQIADKMDSFVNNYLSNEEGKNFRRLYEKIHDEKCLAIMNGKVPIKEKKITLDEFKILAGAEN